MSLSKAAIEAAKHTYNIDYWSDGYFDVNDQGEVTVNHGEQPAPQGISFTQIIQQVEQSGLTLPVLVRFPHILNDRVRRLCDAFSQACEELDYDGAYSAVYPIKVNQQRRVVEEIVHTRDKFPGLNVGLEAGSKPELMVVLAMCEGQPSTIVCNGYKDREYIRLALIGLKMGHRVYIVVEKRSELDLIIDEAKQLGVTPLIGVRARLASIGKGNWQNTGGEKSKFGLSANQLMQVVEQLKDAGLLESLSLLHFHLGSQIANIRDIHRGMAECARFFVELSQCGVHIQCVDVGGGLGVDYEGTQSRNACSMNYSIEEYARNVVGAMKQACTQHHLAQPDIITESGRALTAHHAVLITEVIDQETKQSVDLPVLKEDTPSTLQAMHHVLARMQAISGKPARESLECYHDIVHLYEEMQAQFIGGALNLSHRAMGETLYTEVSQLVRKHLQEQPHRAYQDILDDLNEKLADKLFVNFSLFQSLPDVWGIDQIFPILPLSGLDQPATHRAVIQDITCDSDGRIDEYVDGEGIESTLPLPPPVKHMPYRLGFFMVGAYQEILGDMHNLFGDTDSVDVLLCADGQVQLENPLKGDDVDKVLRYVNFDVSKLRQSYQRQLQGQALESGQVKQLLMQLNAGLSGYTYLE